MPSALDVASLTTQVEELRLSDSHRWTIVKVETADALRVHVEVRPRGSADVYCVRIEFIGGLSAGPASVAFCARETLAEGRLRDWPRGMTNFFKVPPQHGPTGWICNPWTREGRAHHAAEWGGFKWKPSRALWITLTALQDILDKPGSYIGRAA